MIFILVNRNVVFDSVIYWRYMVNLYKKGLRIYLLNVMNIIFVDIVIKVMVKFLMVKLMIKMFICFFWWDGLYVNRVIERKFLIRVKIIIVIIEVMCMMIFVVYFLVVLFLFWVYL